MVTATTLYREAGSVAVLGLVVVAPWAFGGVEEWFRAVGAAVFAACSAGAGGALLATRRGEPWPCLVPLLPLACLACLAACQAGGGVLPLDSEAVSGGPKSVYPAATRLAVSDLLTLIAATFLGAVLFARADRLRFLLMACVVSAALVSVGGIGMRLTGEDRIIRGIEVIGDPFARFVNRNNAAAYLLVGVASGLALLRDAIPVRPSGDGTLLEVAQQASGCTQQRTAISILTSVCLAGIVGSRSRGGVIAAVATVAAGFWAFRGGRSGARVGVASAIVVISTALATWLGLWKPILSRFRLFSVESAVSEGRVPHWYDAARAVAARPIWGAGLGTYGYAYQEFARYPTEVWFEHADNQFLELLVETGAAGCLASAMGIGVAAFIFSRCTDRTVERVLLAALFSGQLCHAAFDYGIVVPAVSWPVAILWGAVSASSLSAGKSAVSAEASKLHTVVRQALLPVIGLFVTFGTGWSCAEHRRAWDVDSAAGTLSAERLPEDIEAAQVRLGRLEATLDVRPDDAEGQRSAGELLVCLYRSEAVTRLRDVDASASAEDVWEMTSLHKLHDAANTLSRSGSTAGLEALQGDAAVRRKLAPALDRYEAAAIACPRLPRIWLPQAELAFVRSGNPIGNDQITTAATLFPARWSVQLLAGHLAWQAGEVQLASRCWQTAFSLNPVGYGRLADELASEIGAFEAVRLTAPSDLRSLLRIALSPEFSRARKLRESFAARLFDAANRSSAPMADRARTIAVWLSNRRSEAEDQFRAAIRRNPEDPIARFDLAIFLLDGRRDQEAAVEIRAALALDPTQDDLRRNWESWRRDTPASSLPPDASGRTVQ